MLGKKYISKMTCYVLGLFKLIISSNISVTTSAVFIYAFVLSSWLKSRPERFGDANIDVQRYV